MVEPNRLSHDVSHVSHGMDLAGAPQHAIVTVAAVRSSWRSDDVTGLAEPARPKLQG